MKFTIATAPFLAAVDRASGAADPRSTMPILATALLRVTGSRLTVAGTDLSVAATTGLAVNNAEDGGICIAAKALRDIIANLPGDSVTVRGVENGAEIKAGRSTYRVVGVPDRDYPKVPDPREVTLTAIDPAVWLAMIKATRATICTDPTRFHLAGILYEHNRDRARMVSTDGHRLSKIDRPTGGPSTPGVIIPQRGVVELAKLLAGVDACEVGIAAPYMFARSGDATLAIKLIDAQFPSYDQVIPKHKDRKGTIEVGASDLAGAFKRASLMTSDTTGVVISKTDRQSIIVTVNHADRGELVEEIAGELTGAEDLRIGVAAKYAMGMVDVLEALAEDDAAKVTISHGCALSPILLESSGAAGFSGVIMPMRV